MTIIFNLLFQIVFLRQLNTSTALYFTMKNLKKIGTHNGAFHVDEILACAMLKKLPEYADAEIIRTRDPKILDECDIVVDVGGVFDPKTHRYDHHQKSFTHSMSTLIPESPFVTKLSSAGLVYVHFGKKLIAQIIEKPESDPLVETIFVKVYKKFMEEIDANDNGIATHDGKSRCVQFHAIIVNGAKNKLQFYGIFLCNTFPKNYNFTCKKRKYSKNRCEIDSLVLTNFLRINLFETFFPLEGMTSQQHWPPELRICDLIGMIPIKILTKDFTRVWNWPIQNSKRGFYSIPKSGGQPEKSLPKHWKIDSMSIRVEKL